MTMFGNPWGKNLFENIAGKGEIAGNQQYLLFQQLFLPFPNEITPFTSANAFNLDDKILSSSQGLNQ